MTLRPGVDLEGLSTFDNREAFASGAKLQMIDTSQLRSLQAIADEFPAGHVFLAPSGPALVEERAAARGTGVVSPYAQEVIDAIVGEMRAP